LTDDQIASLWRRRANTFRNRSARAKSSSRAPRLHPQAAAAVPIAIASGAQRHEIEEILDATQLRGCFVTIVAAGDTVRGKPAPDPYARALPVAAARNARQRRAACGHRRFDDGDSSRRAGLVCAALV
jgi:beta-phosphoglucomutase-like phosphatase (HAD superfamily)